MHHSNDVKTFDDQSIGEALVAERFKGQDVETGGEDYRKLSFVVSGR